MLLCAELIIDALNMSFDAAGIQRFVSLIPIRYFVLGSKFVHRFSGFASRLYPRQKLSIKLEPFFKISHGH